jgi:hypothetical protein
MGRWRPGRGVDEETLAVEEGEMAGEGDEGDEAAAAADI